MGNNTNGLTECCSNRLERENKMATRYERPEFYQKAPPDLNLPNPKLENTSLDPIRQSYNKSYLLDVENTLNSRRSKGKSNHSDASNFISKKQILFSDKSVCSSTLGEEEIFKIKMVRVEKPNSLIKILKKEEYPNSVKT